MVANPQGLGKQSPGANKNPRAVKRIAHKFPECRKLCTWHIEWVQPVFVESMEKWIPEEINN